MSVGVQKPGFSEKARVLGKRLPIAYWVRVIFALWLAWLLIVVGYQAYVAARLQPERPDDSVMWTAKETLKDSQKGKPTLLEPFMNAQVAWDSEFYLSIATKGYDDPAIRSVGEGARKFTLSYAFMPFYPFVTRLVAFPLRVFGLNPIATATLAGVLVSALGALGGMLALYDLARRESAGKMRAETGATSIVSGTSMLEDRAGLDSEGLRSAFYLVAFPTGFWLAQVYTEGLFVGLAFGCLALLRRTQFARAALLAVCATWTRAIGVALVVPMVMAWAREGDWMQLDLEWRQLWSSGVPWRPLVRGLIAFAPLLAFAAWQFSRLRQRLQLRGRALFRPRCARVRLDLRGVEQRHPACDQRQPAGGGVLPRRDGGRSARLRRVLCRSAHAPRRGLVQPFGGLSLVHQRRGPGHAPLHPRRARRLPGPGKMGTQPCVRPGLDDRVGAADGRAGCAVHLQFVGRVESQPLVPQ